jgi:HAD superfamily hydrolase (TIGR01509 family)
MMDTNDLCLEGIAAVYFDAFGTLIGYGGRRLNPYRRLLAADAPKPVGRLPFLMRNVGIDVFARELGLEAALPAMERELAEELTGLILYPEVEAVLDTLRQAGRKVAVCSNLAAAYGLAVRELIPGLDAYVLSFEVGAAKPDPAIYAAVCAALDCSPGEVLFTGDSPWCDEQGLRDFGMRAHGLDRERGQTLWDALAGNVATQRTGL